MGSFQEQSTRDATAFQFCHLTENLRYPSCCVQEQMAVCKMCCETQAFGKKLHQLLDQFEVFT